MANDFTRSQWVVDTVMTTPIFNYVKIANLIWTDQLAAGDQLIIQDGTGGVILDIKASAANIVQTLGGLGWVNGFKVATLTSGKLFIYMATK